LDKNSGDYVQHGFYSQATQNCYEIKYGDVTWYGHPSDTGTGCGGYVKPYVQWALGNTSYLFIDALVTA
jgi:hypothetical protein